jgi:hypothetical protein
MPDDLVALAGGLFETRPIEDFDFAPPVSNKAGILERPRDERDRRPSRPKHLREKVLRKRYRRRPGLKAILCLQQPAGQPRFRVVNGVASRNLLRLYPKNLSVLGDDVLDALALFGGALKRVRGNMREGARQLNNGSGECPSLA